VRGGSWIGLYTEIMGLTGRKFAWLDDCGTEMFGTGTYGTGIEIRPKNESNAMEKMSLCIMCIYVESFENLLVLVTL
jgi:hypothetical protein